MKPFNLEAFKAGAPAITRDGKKATFVAHVPDLHKSSCVLYFVEGEDRIKDCSVSGFYDEVISQHDSQWDLFMAPVKRTVYVQIFNKNIDSAENISAFRAVAFFNENDALRNFGSTSWDVLVKALAVEIEE